ncbi:MAG TPA: NAD(P)H-hydrate dehydratase [Myxococcota bacterium]|nr:NAD(P)H-hydrate dehydratase [Myxococcota bacterium]
MISDARGWPCATGAEMRAVDADAIGRLGIPARTLMESAGRAVAEAIATHFGEARRPLVACGGGNNGGDGYVVARVLAEQGRGVTPRVLELARPERQSPESKANRDLLAGSAVELRSASDPDAIRAALAGCDLVVDAVFGVGLSRPVEGEAAILLRELAASGLPIVAVDVASGASSDSGAPLGLALEPALTVALGLPKLGQALVPAAGTILVADIGFPAESVARAGIRQFLLTREAARALLPPRPLSGHKGTFGHALVVGGSLGKTGAALLSALGALRSGVGLLTIAAPRALLPIYASRLAEAMGVPLADEGQGELGASHIDALLRESGARDALIVGPGLGRSDGTVALARALAVRADVPAVVDADALFALDGSLESLRASAPRVLTPHPGEAARLLGCDTAAVQADRAGSARALARRAQAVAVLKGARSVVAHPAGDLSINPSGGPGLAAGGSGDVLAGVIGALLARGIPAWDAARLGVYLHGAAGDLGPSLGGLASELAARIPAAWRALAEAESRDESGPLHPFP